MLYIVLLLLLIVDLFATILNHCVLHSTSIFTSEDNSRGSYGMHYTYLCGFLIFVLNWMISSTNLGLVMQISRVFCCNSYKHNKRSSKHEHCSSALLELVELENGETYNGHLVNCDTWMK